MYDQNKMSGSYQFGTSGVESDETQCRCAVAEADRPRGGGAGGRAAGRKRPRTVPGSLGRGLWVAVVDGDGIVLSCCGYMQVSVLWGHPRPLPVEMVQGFTSHFNSSQGLLRVPYLHLKC